MKKNLFYYLFAVICSVGLFASCSDDDDDNWKNIPTGPIEGENAKLTVNGATSTGSVQFTPQGATQAKVDLNNVFPGYKAVTVNVSLSEQSDGSFDFSGEQGVSTPPSMITSLAAQAEPAIMNVKVEGNITLEGKLSITATSALTEQAMGGLSGSWNVKDTIVADEFVTTVTSAPFVLRWPAIKVEEGKFDGEQTARIASMLVSHILAEVLGQVTFNPDGNITAKYHSGLPFNGDTAMGWIMNNAFSVKVEVSHTDWTESPKNLAFWYVKDNKLYVVPNIEMIMKQASADQERAEMGGIDMAGILEILSQMGIDITKLDPAVLEQVMGWLHTGIPLNYRTDADGGLEIYVDKEMVAPFMPIIFSMLPMLQEQLDKMAQEQPLIGMLPLLLAIDKLTDYQTIWENNTKEFEIAIDLQK